MGFPKSETKSEMDGILLGVIPVLIPCLSHQVELPRSVPRRHSPEPSRGGRWTGCPPARGADTPPEETVAPMATPKNRAPCSLCSYFAGRKSWNMNHMDNRRKAGRVDMGNSSETWISSGSQGCPRQNEQRSNHMPKRKLTLGTYV